MESGFKVHKHAAVLENNLNSILRVGETKEVIDITMVYEYPIRLTSMILAKLNQKNHRLAIRSQWIIEMIIVRYQPYESYVLTQLDHFICRALCKDLEMLFEQMKIS